MGPIKTRPHSTSCSSSSNFQLDAIDDDDHSGIFYGVPKPVQLADHLFEDEDDDDDDGIGVISPWGTGFDDLDFWTRKEFLAGVGLVVLIGMLLLGLIIHNDPLPNTPANTTSFSASRS